MATLTEFAQMSPGTRSDTPRRNHRGAGARLARLALVLVLVTFASVGAYGAYRYVWNFWLFRGYAAPSEPTSVVVAVSDHVHHVAVLKGALEQITIKSKALGGLEVPVLVYLPPGYSTHPHERYPVFYLLHGRPGQPLGFIRVADMGTTEDELVAEHRLNPLILVMPGSGQQGLFAPDSEWANGVHSGMGWETFLSRDVVNTIDARFRTIRGSDGRAIAGLSEGGFGAINVGLHHPDTFGVIQSWSGYMLAAKVPTVFGRSAHYIAYNSPLKELPSIAATMRADHSFVWYYCGTHDYSVAQNQAFATELADLHIPHTFLLEPGGHTWALWRSMASAAMTAVSEHLAHG